MATVRKQISNGKIVIECSEAEFNQIRSSVQSTYEDVLNSEHTTLEELNDLARLVISLTPPGDESQHSTRN